MLQHLRSIHYRQLHVKYDGVGTVMPCQAQSNISLVRKNAFITFFADKIQDDICERNIILNNQDDLVIFLYVVPVVSNIF